MRALHFTAHGEIDNLSLGDLVDPHPQPDEVVLKVGACAINHLDLWVLKGWPGLKLEMPHVGGADIAGKIVEVGSNITSWKIGTRVVVNPGFLLPGPDD